MRNKCVFLILPSTQGEILYICILLFFFFLNLIVFSKVKFK